MHTAQGCLPLVDIRDVAPATEIRNPTSRFKDQAKILHTQMKIMSSLNGEKSVNVR